MSNRMDKLIQKIKETNNPTVIGLDPKYENIPEYIREKYEKNLDGAAKAILEFNKKLIDETNDIIPAIKPQIAYYEMYGIEGLITFKETCKYAKEKGMIVIADIKRGDIGTTVAAYSSAYIGKTTIGDIEESVFDVDFITVNPYLGTDGIEPFVQDCIKYDKGLFILDKTSNPSSGELQDVKTENGQTIYEVVADLINKWGKDLIGENGYSNIGAVVGATYPEQLKSLRQQMPNTYFLIPGYGAQGGKANDIALGFDNLGLGGIVNNSRGLMNAYQKEEYKEDSPENFAKATRKEAIKMRDILNNSIKKGE